MNMWQTIKKYPTALIWAVAVHVLVFIAIGVSFKVSEPNISAVKQEKVISAVAIDEAQVNAEINKLKKAEKRKAQQQKRLKNEEQRAKKERRKEEKRLQAIKKEQQKQERLFKKKQQDEKKRLAELEKKAQEQERKQKEIEQKRKETEEKLSRLEKQRQEKQAQLEKEEKERKAKIAKQKHDAEERQRVELENKEIAKYKSLIKSYVENKWIYLDSYKKGLVCIIQIKLFPSGDVRDATIIQTSGDSAFDRSARVAAMKASPLPVPKNDTDLFQREFKVVNLKFNPSY